MIFAVSCFSFIYFCSDLYDFFPFFWLWVFFFFLLYLCVCVYIYVCVCVCVCLYNWITAVHQKIKQHYKSTILVFFFFFLILDREFVWPDPRKDFSESKGAANKRCGDPLGCNHYALVADSFKWDHSTQQLEGTLLYNPLYHTHSCSDGCF